MSTKQLLLSKLPQVSKILQHTSLSPFLAKYSHNFIVFCIQSEIDAFRSLLLDTTGAIAPPEDTLNYITKQVIIRLEGADKPSLRRVINATGIILHTGLGRAPFSRKVQANLGEIVNGYCNIELDLVTGQRGERVKHVEELICFLTGAEAACVVNNNAAGVLIILNTLSFQKETIVSRGQLVEIGGSFRIPEVMEKSGTRMVEVGTTNKTHLHDYERAISQSTGLICIVHTSNYRVQGFTKEVDVAELVKLAGVNEVPIMQDLGGGVLMDLRQFGLPYEPVAKESIAAGVDLVTFSGDKILGGPQCGIIIGKKKYLEQIRANPLMRALRCDKLVFAVLEPTLKDFLLRDGLAENNEVLNMLLQTEERLAERAQLIIDKLHSVNSADLGVAVEDTSAQTGSGAMPLEEIPSKAITISTVKTSINSLAHKFRKFSPAIVGYVREDRLYLDLRTVFPEEDKLIVSAVEQILTII